MSDFFMYRSADDMARSVAEKLATIVNDALDQRGKSMLVLSGGNTPGLAYHYLADKKLDWSRVTVTLADDRWVPRDHAASNARMLFEKLFVGNAKQATFIDLVTSDATPDSAVEFVSAQLQGWPDAYDAAVLGMGADGHTASLFPGSLGIEAAMDTHTRSPVAAITPDPLPPEAPFPRMTLTLSRLLKVRHHMLLISGEKKRCIYDDALEHNDPARLPIAAFLHHPNLSFETFWTP